MVIQAAYDGSIAGQYESITRAEKETGINRGSIHHAINNSTESHGFKWYKNKDDYNADLAAGALYKIFKVFQCNDKGDILHIYNKYPEAEIATNITRSNICRACQTDIHAGGFKWFNCYQDYKIFMEQKTA